MQHSITLTRLRAGRRYQFEVIGSQTQGDFTTDPLPPDLVGIVGIPTGTRTTPLLMLHLYDPSGFKGYAILDEANEIVWYWRTTDFTFGMTRRANGDFVMMDKVRGLVEVTPAGTEVAELAQSPAREMHHDVIATAANTLLFIAFDDRTVNGAVVRGDAIWEWTPETGATVKRWSSWDHFSAANAPPPRHAVQWLHANSLAIGPRQNILLSVHDWNQILSITPGLEGHRVEAGGNWGDGTCALRCSPEQRHRAGAGGRLGDRLRRVARGTDSRAIEYTIDGDTAR